jgi:hypothetical protein
VPIEEEEEEEEEPPLAYLFKGLGTCGLGLRVRGKE